MTTSPKGQLAGYCYDSADPMLATFRKNHPRVQHWTDDELAALLLEAVEYGYRLAENDRNTNEHMQGGVKSVEAENSPQVKEQDQDE